MRALVLEPTDNLGSVTVGRVQEGPQASDWGDQDRLVLRAADELHRDAHVSDQTWNALREQLSVQELMDLVFTAGQYTLVSMALNSFGVLLVSCHASKVASARSPWSVARRDPPGMVPLIAKGRNAATGQGERADATLLA